MTDTHLGLKHKDPARFASYLLSEGMKSSVTLGEDGIDQNGKHIYYDMVTKDCCTYEKIETFHKVYKGRNLPKLWMFSKGNPDKIKDYGIFWKNSKTAIANFETNEWKPEF